MSESCDKSVRVLDGDEFYLLSLTDRGRVDALGYHVILVPKSAESSVLLQGTRDIEKCTHFLSCNIPQGDYLRISCEPEADEPLYIAHEIPGET